jgi:Zn-dependent protease with chaperone function
LLALLLVALVVLLGGLYLLGLALQPEPVVERHRMESRFNAAGEFETIFIDRFTGEVRTTTLPKAAPGALPLVPGQSKPRVTVTHVKPEAAPAPPRPFPRWDPFIFLWTAGLGAVVIAVTCRLRFKELSRGGSFLALSLGGKVVPRGTSDPKLRQFLNVVEEMALASAVPVPKCYVLEGDPGINAFAAGRKDDFALGVTRGALEQLSRDELQALVAHEFSLIDQDDMRRNLIIIGVLAGLLVITKLGLYLMRQAIPATFSKEFHRAWFFVAVGAIAIGAGLVGAYFARVILAQYEEALMTLENVLESVTEAEFKDFEFIIDIERKIALTLRKLDRENEADEIARRLDAVTEVIDEA